MTESSAHSFLVKGEDPSLVLQEARNLIDELLGDRDHSLTLEDYSATSDAFDVGIVVDALATPPFLVDRRVIVLREIGKLRADDAKRLAEALGKADPSCRLVLVGGGGATHQSLGKAVDEARDATVKGNDRTKWFTGAIHEGGVKLTSAARVRLMDQIGEDLSRVTGILSILTAAFGEGATVDVDQLEPFLGSAGGVPQWDLTNAIDGRETEKALGVFRRLSLSREPTVILSILHKHFSGMLLLDGSDVATKDEAAALLGMHPFPASKVLGQVRRLGGERIRQAITLLADADLDLKGRSALPSDVILEVLIARLSRLSPLPSR